MTTNIQNLIDAWDLRPALFDPYNDQHLMWVSTKLLPALRDAIPDVSAIRPTQLQEPDEAFPSTMERLEQALQSNTRIPNLNPYKADNDGVMDQILGSDGKSEFSTGNPVDIDELIRLGYELKKEQDARIDADGMITIRVPDATNQPSLVPPEQPQETDETGKA